MLRSLLRHIGSQIAAARARLLGAASAAAASRAGWDRSAGGLMMLDDFR